MARSIGEKLRNNKGKSGVKLINSQNVPGVGKPSEEMPPDTLGWPYVSIFRPLPMVEDKKLLPPFQEDGQLTDWLFIVKEVGRQMGNRMNQQVTVSTELPEDDNFGISPVRFLVDRVKELENDPSQGAQVNQFFSNLRKGAPGRSPAVPDLKTITLVQAAVYIKTTNQKTHNWNPPQYTTLMLSYSMGIALDKLFSQDMFSDNLDLLNMLFDPNQGDLMLATHSSKQSLQLPALQGSWDVMASSDDMSKQSDQDTAKYVCHLVKPPKGFEIPTEEDIKSRWIHWDNVYKVMSGEDQLKALCNAYTPEVITKVFANSDFEGYLPEATQRLLCKPQEQGYNPQPSEPSENNYNQTETTQAAKPEPAPQPAGPSEDVQTPIQSEPVTQEQSEPEADEPAQDQGNDPQSALEKLKRLQKESS